MVNIQIKVQRVIEAEQSLIYELIADFRNHHHRFLPPEFSDLTVKSGGYGAGTEASYKLKLGGSTMLGHIRVEEPEPGKVLTESDPSRSFVTAFRLDPHGQGTLVTIESNWTCKNPIRGLVEKLIVPGLLRPLYEEELKRLAAYAAEVSTRRSSAQL